MAATDHLGPQFHEATSITPPSLYNRAKAEVMKAAAAATPIAFMLAKSGHVHGIHL